MSAAIVARLALEAEQVGWRQAALAVLENEPDLLTYVHDERSGDWRFILPQMPAGCALCVGGALSPVPLILASTCDFVEVYCGSVEGSFLMARARQEGIRNISVLHTGPVKSDYYDLVAGLRSHARPRWRGQNLPELAGAVKEGGSLYLEVPARALQMPPALVRGRLRRHGFGAIRGYWPKPTFRRCEMLLPLSDRSLQRYYLDYQFYALSTLRRVIRLLLKLAVSVDLFELTVPEYLVVATKRGRVRV